MANYLMGMKFSRLFVKSEAGSNKKKLKQWLCVCDCGNEKVVAGSDLISGNTKSCGCLNIERIRERSLKHGHTKQYKLSPEYQSWRSMIKRCTQIKNVAYHNYGGRGIKVCDRWIERFENFFEDMGKKPSPNQSLDRIDVNGNYEPGNCKWSTGFEQSRNQRLSRKSNSGVRGVSWNARDKLWYAVINVDKKRKHIGCFKTKEEAIEERRKAELKYWGKSS